MSTIKVTYTDGETVEEKETELILRPDMVVEDFSRQGYALVQAICRILKSEGKI